MPGVPSGGGPQSRELNANLPPSSALSTPPYLHSGFCFALPLCAPTPPALTTALRSPWANMTTPFLTDPETEARSNGVSCLQWCWGAGCEGLLSYGKADGRRVS